MSKYTTGELAKLCGVTVRTVQYYDQRGILIPSELSEGGRRVYSDSELKRMKMICFLRELDLSIEAISQILQEEHPEKLLSLLIEQQDKLLSDEIGKKKEKLAKLRELKNELASKDQCSLESISDMTIRMKDKKKLKKLRQMVFLTALPMGIMQWTCIIFWIVKGVWWPFVLCLLIAVVWGSIMIIHYFRNVQYICPECHQTFRPSVKELILARHTPTTRKLTCTKCGHKGFCVEIWGGEEKTVKK